MVRSRLVARDFKGKDRGDREDLFAATPPLEGQRLLLSRAVTRRRTPGKPGVRKLMFIDAKKAHLNPRCEDDVFIELPEEAGAGDGVCGKLEFWLYGFRPAAQAWENHYAEKLEGVGFQRGKRSPVIFYNAERDLSCVVHGDDFTIEGVEEELRWLAGVMEKWFEIKVRAVLGPGRSDEKEVVILGRKVTWKEWGIEYEADAGHREKIMEHFGFEEGKTRRLMVNGGKVRGDEEVEEVSEEVAQGYRKVAARFNYVAQDGPDIQFGTKEVCRGMSGPTKEDWDSLKKLARYMVGRKRVVWRFEYQDEGQKLKVCTDSDWAGCKKTRKSSSGGVLMLGSHCIKTWCSTQGALALSSAEAEFYSMVEGVMRSYGVAGLAEELGMEVKEVGVNLFTDSSAAKAFASRRGVGKMRHMQVRWLWLQEEVRRGRVKVYKIKGTENPADLLTKYLSVKEVEERLRGMSLEVEWAAESVGSR